MYRQYENPYELEQQLAELQEEYNSIPFNAETEGRLIALGESIEELRDRINFAWQDDEAESEW